jgi:opacity protein-like surface antigen
MNADGSGAATTVFKIGSNVYSSSTFHCNYIIYHPADDTYTISDRNPNLVVKVKHDGTPIWQVGGSCTSAKAPKCASGTWVVNHGHDLDDNDNMLVFNNGQSGGAHVLELKLNETTSAISFTTTKDFSSGNTSNVLGDVQFLPNGNILITYSTSGVMVEVDSSWTTVQTLKSSFGYAGWRETLYGPPTRK